MGPRIWASTSLQALPRDGGSASRPGTCRCCQRPRRSPGYLRGPHVGVSGSSQPQEAGRGRRAPSPNSQTPNLGGDLTPRAGGRAQIEPGCTGRWMWPPPAPQARFAEALRRAGAAPGGRLGSAAQMPCREAGLRPPATASGSPWAGARHAGRAAAPRPPTPTPPGGAALLRVPWCSGDARTAL